MDKGAWGPTVYGVAGVDTTGLCKLPAINSINGLLHGREESLPSLTGGLPEAEGCRPLC